MDFQPQPPKNEAGNPGINKWQEIADELRRHPGEWAVVKHSATDRGPVNSSHRGIRSGMLVAFRPAGDFDAKTRTNPDGGFDLWASYNG